VGPASGAGHSNKAPYKDTSLPPQVRAKDLVRRMTLEEKASQLVNHSRAIPRLGVPAYDWWSEALHGVATKGTTEFPEPIALAATFDTAAIHQMAETIGVEGRIKHDEAMQKGYSSTMEGLDFWAPNVNIFRDPRWGRGQETYGEDPFLTGRMAVAYVTGMQGDDPHYYRAISTPKHYAVHSGPEPTRHFADVDVSKHDMEDTYLPAFRAAVTEGHAGSVMCAYNAVNGEPACANRFLLQHMLRGAWKFGGYVVSDCGAVHDIFEGHRYRSSQPQATAVSVMRGMDNECITWGEVSGRDDYQPYIDAMRRGYLPQSAADAALIRLFTARMRLGMFDPSSQVPYEHLNPGDLDSPAHRELALRLAEESMVLLKNDGVLPIRNAKRIGVIGPLADQTQVLLGNYTGTPTHVTSVVEGMKAAFPGAQIIYVPGTQFLSNVGEPVPGGFFATADGQPGLRADYRAGEDKNVGSQAAAVANRTDREPDLLDATCRIAAQHVVERPLDRTSARGRHWRLPDRHQVEHDGADHGRRARRRFDLRRDQRRARPPREGRAADDRHRLSGRLQRSAGAAHLAAGERHARPCRNRRCAERRRGRCRRRHHKLARGRGNAGQRAGLPRRRPDQHRPAGSGGRAGPCAGFGWKACRRRADEWQRACRPVGEGARQCDPRSLVSGRRGRTSNREHPQRRE
jgi:beta-glucosidase